LFEKKKIETKYTIFEFIMKQNKMNSSFYANKISDIIHKIKNEILNEEKMNEIENIITCPISHEIFKNPVIADDKFTYEETEILNWFKNHNTSPLTGKKISKNLSDDVNMKQLINIFLLKKQEFNSINLLGDNYILKIQQVLEENCKKIKKEIIEAIHNSKKELNISLNYDMFNTSFSELEKEITNYFYVKMYHTLFSELKKKGYTIKRLNNSNNYTIKFS
jgi:hypothetical protein